MISDDLELYTALGASAALLGALIAWLVLRWRANRDAQTSSAALAATLCLNLVVHPDEWEALAGSPGVFLLRHRRTGVRLRCDRHVRLCEPDRRFRREDEVQIQAAVMHYLTARRRPYPVV
jgi:hypothetical protein